MQRVGQVKERSDAPDTIETNSQFFLQMQWGTDQRDHRRCRTDNKNKSDSYQCRFHCKKVQQTGCDTAAKQDQNNGEQDPFNLVGKRMKLYMVFMADLVVP